MSEDKWQPVKTVPEHGLDRIRGMIDAFDRECAAKGHHFAPNPIAPGTDYCQACGATRPTQGDHQ